MSDLSPPCLGLGPKRTPMRRRLKPALTALHSSAADAPKSSWRALRHRLRRALRTRWAYPLLATLLFLVAVLVFRPSSTSPLRRSRLLRRVLHVRCTGHPELLTSAVHSHVEVNIGDCVFKFSENAQCPPSLAAIADATGLPSLPCANWTLTLTNAMRISVLRKFGVRRRSSAQLPMQVYGALLPADTAPFAALETPESRPYTWDTVAGRASACSPGRCRAMVRAMLLSYVAGCGPLHNNALWSPSQEQIYDPRLALPKVLLAFPRQCGRGEHADAIAEDLLVRYLRRVCEVPLPFWQALPSMASHGRVGKRASFLLHTLGSHDAWWWQTHLVGSITGCPDGIQGYEFDGWEEGHLDEWQAKLDSVAREGGNMQK